MKKVLITGGAGFIGSHLVEKYLSLNCEVIMLDNFFRGKIDNISGAIERGAKLYEMDLISDTAVSDLTELLANLRPDYILHYAAINGTQYFYDRPMEVAAVNSVGTFNLLRSIENILPGCQAYIPKLVFASSSEVYCEPLQLPTSESAITYARINQDRDSYAVAKLMSEFYVRLFAKKNGLPFVIFRIFNTYGPRMVGSKYGQIIPEIIFRLANGEYPLKLLGSGEHTRSFMYIDDHVDLTIRCIEAVKKGAVVNLGNPSEISIQNLANLVMQRMSIEPAIEYLPEREGDHLRRLPDINVLYSLVGGHKFWRLEDGIDKMLESLV